MGSDNQGNVYAMLNVSSRKPHTTELVLQLQLHKCGCAMTPNHIPKEFNTWADELTHPGYPGFPGKQASED